VVSNQAATITTPAVPMLSLWRWAWMVFTIENH